MPCPHVLLYSSLFNPAPLLGTYTFTRMKSSYSAADYSSPPYRVFFTPMSTWLLVSVSFFENIANTRIPFFSLLSWHRHDTLQGLPLPCITWSFLRLRFLNTKTHLQPLSLIVSRRPLPYRRPYPIYVK